MLNLLLEYASEVGCGSWSRLRETIAAAQVGTSPILVARNFEALGHVELDLDSDSWSICPPALAEVPSGENSRVILCGARTAKMVQAFRDAAQHYKASFAATPQPGGPDVVVAMSPDRDSIMRLSDALAIPVLEDSARRLAACLPSVSSLARVGRCEPLPTTRLERLVDDGNRLQALPWAWEPVAQGEGPGLYRQRRMFSYQHWLVGDGQPFRVEKPVGLYNRSSQLLRYDRANRRLSFAPEARPPSLYLKALTLCSGRLPTPGEDGRIELRGVPEDIFRQVSLRLEQEALD